MLCGSLLICLSFFYCTKSNVLSNVRAGDFSIVYEDNYRGTLRLLREGGDYHEIIGELRTDIEKDMTVLDTITARSSAIPHKQYKFKYAAVDKDANFLVLRYFARIVEHPVYAGHQIQFVFDITTWKIQKIFVSEVPLE
jgi:hypothetical protein